MRILTVEKLCKHFGGLKALNNLDFHIDEGEIVGIIGPNGSGKTTFLNLLTGFLKPNSGSITFQRRRNRSITPLQGMSERNCQDLPIV